MMNLERLGQSLAELLSPCAADCKARTQSGLGEKRGVVKDVGASQTHEGRMEVQPGFGLQGWMKHTYEHLWASFLVVSMPATLSPPIGQLCLQDGESQENESF